MTKEIDWSSIEVGCWSRDFNYKEYLRYVNKSASGSKPVSAKEYNTLCEVCEKEYTETMEWETI